MQGELITGFRWRTRLLHAREKAPECVVRVGDVPVARSLMGGETPRERRQVARSGPSIFRSHSRAPGLLLAFFLRANTRPVTARK